MKNVKYVGIAVLILIAALGLLLSGCSGGDKDGDGTGGGDGKKTPTTKPAVVGNNPGTGSGGNTAVNTSPADDKVALNISLPAPMFKGTPEPIKGEPNMGPARKGKRPPFFAPRGTVNLARGKPVTSSDPEPIIGELRLITDGDKRGNDGCFVESARSLALQGAEVVLWPSLQRGYTESELMLQVRAHAHFNGVVIVRSSYGTERGRPWRPGTMVGLSCVCGSDGHVVASLGRWAGWTSATVDLDAPPGGERSFGGETGVLREMRAADRRPETYGAITRTR